MSLKPISRTKQITVANAKRVPTKKVMSFLNRFDDEEDIKFATSVKKCLDESKKLSAFALMEMNHGYRLLVQNPYKTTDRKVFHKKLACLMHSVYTYKID